MTPSRWSFARSARRAWQGIRCLFPTVDQWRALASPFGRANAWLPWHVGPHFLAWWRKSLTDENKHFLSNLFTGLAITVVLQLMHGSRVVNALEDTSLDWMIAMFGATRTSSAVSFVWIDIDERTFQEWKEPLYTPRQQLRTLIQFAADSAARVVVVDVDLATPSGDAAGDESLKSYFKEFSIRCGNQAENACPQIILTRSFRRTLPRDELQERRSFLDPVVVNSSHVHWGSPLYLRSSDWLIRGANLWQTSCNGSQANTVPSIPLLARCLWQGHDLDKLRLAIQEHEKGKCDDTGRVRSSAETRESLHVCGMDIDESGSRLASRILFSVPWSAARVDSEVDEAGTERGEPQEVGSRSVGWLSTMSAASILNAGTRQPVSKELLKDRIIIIGGSFDASGDLHPTPLGPMPGALVVANAIHSLAEHGQIGAPSLWVVLPWEALFLLVMSMPFAAFNSFFGMLWSSLFVLLLTLPVSLLLFHSGSWLSFMIPLVSVQFHRLVSALEAEGKRRHNA